MGVFYCITVPQCLLALSRRVCPQRIFYKVIIHNHNAMKVNRGRISKAPIISYLGNRRRWSTSQSGRFTPQEITLGTYWVDPEPGLYVAEYRKIPAPAGIPSLTVQAAGSHFTNWTALAHHFAPTLTALCLFNLFCYYLFWIPANYLSLLLKVVIRSTLLLPIKSNTCVTSCAIDMTSAICQLTFTSVYTTIYFNSTVQVTDWKAGIFSAGHDFYGTQRYSQKPTSEPYCEPLEFRPHA